MEQSRLRKAIPCTLALFGSLVTFGTPKCIVKDAFREPVDAIQVRSFLDRDEVKKAPDPIDSLICCLPESMQHDPPYVYYSHSNQPATSEEPRVLLSGPDGQPVLAFSGKSNGIEMIDARESAHLSFKRFTPSNHDSGLDSEINCDLCHQGHYLWHTYPFWPGVIGVSDGKDSEEEKEIVQSFQKRRPKMLRYRCLLESGEMGSRNEKFGVKLWKRNLERVTSTIEEQKTLVPFRAALIGLALCRREVTEFNKEQFDRFKKLETYVPPWILERLPKEEQLKARSDEVFNLQWQYNLQKVKEIKAANGNRYPTYLGGSRLESDLLNYVKKGAVIPLENLELLPELLVITKSLAKSDVIDNWSLVPSTSYSFNSGGYEGSFQRKVLTNLAPKWIASLGMQIPDRMTVEWCAKLAEKSQVELARHFTKVEPSNGGKRSNTSNEGSHN